MWHRLLLALVLGGGLLATGAAAQPAPRGQECPGSPGALPEARIESCSALIESGKGDATERAAAYKNRGNAWSAKGDLDRAIADYTQAIRLDPKYAVAYSNRGLAYTDKGDFDRAIADFTEAIRINPLPPGNIHVNVYVNRGAAYVEKGDFDRAIADYSEAIRIDPKDALAYDNRGVAYADKGDLGRAIADADAAIRLDPKDAFGYYNRGRANLYAGSLSKAVADLTEASKLDPTYAYGALWLELATKRGNLPSRLADAAKRIDMTKWPAPIIRLYLGQSTLQAVLAAAESPNAKTRKGQVCEANFWGGELALQQGHKDGAKRLFGVAAADCPKGFIEYTAAKAELAALGENR